MSRIAAWALKEIGEEAVMPLINALKDSDDKCVIMQQRHLRDRNGWVGALENLADGNDDVRMWWKRSER